MIIKTAEAVSPAHPDKLCDQISDLILTEFLTQDPNARVAIEALGGHGEIVVMGEVTAKAEVDIKKCVRQVLQDNRYNPDDYQITTNIVQQSPDIARGVDTGGAGDQGIMVGYACRGSGVAAIPEELYFAKQILKELWKNPKCRDAKSQVTMQGDKITKIVVSAERMTKEEVLPVLDEICDLEGVEVLINPAGDWNNGGFEADTGLTGRKLIVDNYGPQVEIGGGAFSGKDPSKVDRSAAYAARQLALDYLWQNEQVREVKVKIAYAIGVAEPLMVSVQMDNGPVQDVTAEFAKELTPAKIIEDLGLKNINYYEVAKWGSFGNNFPWEQLG